MSQFNGLERSPIDLHRLEVVSVVESPDLIYGVYDVLNRNREALSRFGNRTSMYYPSFEAFATDVTCSIEGRRTITTDTVVYFNAVVLRGEQGEVSDVIGEIDVTLDDNDEHSRILGYYGDADRGFTDHGLFTKAVGIVVDRLFEDPDIDTVCAYVNRKNLRSIKLLQRLGFEKTVQEQGFGRFVRAKSA